MPLHLYSHILQDRTDSEQYLRWYAEFNTFLKEGVCSDFTHKADLARLLRFESSAEAKGKLIAIDDYVGRMPPSQKNIYYLCAPNRTIAESSPYYEGLKAAGTEVLFLYHPMDEFVMSNLREYNKRKLVSAEKSTEGNETQRQKQEAEHAELLKYVRGVLGNKVISVTVSNRITSHPAIIVDHDSASVRKLVRMMDSGALDKQGNDLPKQKLEINPDHPIFRKLMASKDNQPDLAKKVVDQVYDNALLAADILDNPRNMLPRLFSIMESALLNDLPPKTEANVKGEDTAKENTESNATA